MTASPFQRRLAREWLYLVGLISFGGIILPASLILTFEGVATFWNAFRSFYAALFAEGLEFWFAWSVLLAPYLVVQLARSLRWALKTTRVPE
jgi:hypothetical protein